MLNPFSDDSSILRLINAAQNVPSAGRPWSFWIRADDRIELRANFGEHARQDEERIRRPGIAHPLWREPLITCGAALFNLRLAIRVSGHDVSAWLLPDPEGDPALLASVEIVTGRIRKPSVAVQEMYDAISRQRTLPGAPGVRPAPENVVAAMVVASFAKQGWLRLLNRPQARAWLKEAAKAGGELAANGAFSDELLKWTGNGTWELGAAAPVPGPHRLQQTTGWAGRRRAGRRRPGPQLMTLSTRADRPLDWLRAGQAMQRALLIGARYGVAASFVTEPLQLADMRASLAGVPPEREWPWKWPLAEAPQVVLRVGLTEPAGPAAAAEERPGAGGQRSPRFPEVLDLRSGLPREVMLPAKLKPAEAA